MKLSQHKTFEENSNLANEVSEKQEKQQETEKELMERCMKLAQHSEVGVFLYEAKVEDGEVVSTVDRGTRIMDKVQPLLRYANGWLYLDIEFPADGDVNLKSIKHYYMQYLDKNTELATDETKEYLYMITLTGITDDGEVYETEFLNPAFMAQDENILRYATVCDLVRFNHLDMDIDQFNLEQEVEADMTGNYGDADDPDESSLPNIY